MMNTCNGAYGAMEHWHDEIVHEGKECPLCKASKLIEDLNKEIARLNRENTQMDEQLAMCSDACGVCPSRFECVTTKKA